MNLAALRASPSSYAERAHTFRAARGNAPASRARLGSESFIDLQIHSSMLASFVLELVSQHRPASVEDGFRHLRSLEVGRADIADNDQSVFTRDPSGRDVKMMPSGIGNLGVDRLRTFLFTSALSGTNRRFVAPIVFRRRNRETIATHGETFETQVDTDHSDAGVGLRLNFACQREVPASAGILNEGSNLGLADDFAREPEPISLSTINHRIAIKSDSAAPKRNPPEALFLGPPPRTFTRADSAFDENAAHLADCLRHDAEFTRAAGGQICEVEMAGPPASPLHRLPLDIGTVIPDEIHGSCVRLKAGAATAVFDAEFVGQEHAGNLAFLRDSDKPARAGEPG